MATAIRTQIQAALLTILKATAFDGIAVGNIRVGELPEGEAVIAPVPCVMICPYGATRTESSGLEAASVNRIYPIEITLIDATNGDFVVDQGKYETWQENVMNAIRRDGTGQARDTLPPMSSVWRIEILDAPTFDREKLSKLYAYQSVVVEIHSCE